MTSIKPDILKSAGLLRNVTQESNLEPTEQDRQDVLRKMEGHAFAAEANEYRAKVMESAREVPAVEFDPDEYQKVMQHDEFADSDTPAPAPSGVLSSAGGSVRRDPFRRPPVVMANQPQAAPAEPVFHDDAAFERTRKEAEVLVDDSPLGHLTPFKPGFTRNRLFDEIPEAPEEFTGFPTRHPFVENEGKTSNVVLRSETFDGTTYAIPTMVEGKQLHPDAAVEIAQQHGLQKYPSFQSIEQAEDWIQTNHGSIREDGSLGAIPFDEAFASARESGLAEFEWQGKQFTTEMAEEPQAQVGPIIAKSDPIEALRSLVTQVESGGDYNVVAGGKQNARISTNTVAENKKKYGNKALGRYQIQAATAYDMLRNHGQDPLTFVFDEAGQDQIFQWLLERRGLKAFQAGELPRDAFASNLSKEWAGLPSGHEGRSYYGHGNEAGASWQELLDALN